MLPDGVISTHVVSSSFLTPLRKVAYVDFEWGGLDIQDTSKGLLYRLWESYYDGTTIRITDGVKVRRLLTLDNVTYHSFAFDQNMQPCVAYVQRGVTKFWYYDTVGDSYITTVYEGVLEYPQLTLDDHRTNQLGNSDVFLSYIREGKLYYRLQRDRYLIEHFVQDAPNHRLTQTGMTRNYRFRWRLVHKIKGE